MSRFRNSQTHDEHFYDMDNINNIDDEFIENTKKLVPKETTDHKRKNMEYNSHDRSMKIFNMDDGTTWHPTKHQMTDDKNDMLSEYYRKMGINNEDNDVIYNTDFVTVNSSDRVITEKIVTSHVHNLSNVLSLTASSNQLTLSDTNSYFIKDDLITISNINATNTKIRTILKSVDISSVNMTFTNGSQYVTFTYTHTFSYPYNIEDDASLAGIPIKSDYSIYLHSIDGLAASTLLGNIPVESLVGTYHDVYLKQNVSTTFDIKLTTSFTGTTVTYTTTSPIYKRYITFTNNNEYMEILYTHGIAVPQTSIISLDYVDTGDFIIFDDIGGLNTTHIGNIPLNFLNKRCHKLYVRNEYNVTPVITAVSGTTYILADRVFIKLDRSFSGTQSISNHNFSFQINSLGGIHLDLINTGNLTKYHRIMSTSGTDHTIELSQKAVYSISSTGGNMQIGKISEFIKNNINPNKYSIDLPEAFLGVIQVKLVNTIIPNTVKTIKDGNNKLYWQNLDDGNTIYSMTIPEGYYTKTELESEINSLSLEVARISNTSLSSYKYRLINDIRADIHEHKNIVEFRSYKIAELIKPVVHIYPPISANPDDDVLHTNTIIRRITIKHINHYLDIGDKITISNAVATFGIPASILNSEHTIIEIASSDSYIVELPLFTFSTDRTDTGGGPNVYIDIPNSFRLLFDYDDTSGEVFGFRNIGESGSMTQFGDIIKNTDLYENEQDNSSTVITSVKLKRDNYIMFNLVGYSTIHNTGPVKENFSLINTDGDYGGILYNKHTNTTKTFSRPLKKLRTLDIEFYGTDGELFNFDDKDHSFTLAITTENKRPLGTNIV
jgi:hypothetical protein